MLLMPLEITVVKKSGCDLLAVNKSSGIYLARQANRCKDDAHCSVHYFVVLRATKNRFNGNVKKMFIFLKIFF